MKEESRRDRNKPKKSERAAMAARDPKPIAVNRPGFDLGGATGDAEPDDKSHIQGSTGHAQGAVKTAAARARATPRSKPGKTQSAVAGVRNWLRGK